MIILSLFAFSVFAEPPKVVYRAVLEPPDVVKQTGGFLPRGSDGTRPNQPPPNISLYNHTRGAETGLSRHDSGYVSTTTSLDIVCEWVRQNLRGAGYIYHIHPTGNFIDANGTLRRFSPHPREQEYASLGMIRWNQIIGWQRVNFGVLEGFVRNRDYNSNLYSQSHAGDVQYQLAGFPPEHEAWGMAPWRDFSNCSNSHADLTKNCRPYESSQKFGEEYYYEVINKLILYRILYFISDW